MAGHKTLKLEDILQPDDIALKIAAKFIEWEMLRQTKISEWTEVRKYVFAVDTTYTPNAVLPWKNKTTIPKLCQIRDNLLANYIKSLFPKRKWLKWEAFDEPSAEPEKRKVIENYMYWAIERSDFRNIIINLLSDYVDYGNVIAMPEWKDNRQELPEKDQVGYVGPAVKRISPIDTVFNPTSPSFQEAPKIVRSLVSIGDVKKLLEQMTTEENKQELEDLFNYLLEIRRNAVTSSDEKHKDDIYNVDGFHSFKAYLDSDYAEILTFYGDMYDSNNDKFYQNAIIKVVDRHKILSIEPNPSFFGRPPIYHCGWRKRQDNLWAMGPLDNLVGMQYRIDHLENLKADVFDLIAFPPLKIKGLVEDFEWSPFARIYVGDDGDVEVLSPDVNALQANMEIMNLENQMEEMAGAPKEALGFRTPGEKTAYEVQRLENAASRIFQAKIEQFEEQIIEPLLNAMLELARRKLNTAEIRIFDDEFQVEIFRKLTAKDITGNGRLKPVAARHFAEKAERVQNLSNFFQSAIGQNPNVSMHFSGIKLAEAFTDLLDIQGYDLVTPFVALTEQAEAQKLMNATQEQVQTEALTPSGLTPDDSTEPIIGG